jgi:hypothetical protein
MTEVVSAGGSCSTSPAFAMTWVAIWNNSPAANAAMTRLSTEVERGVPKAAGIASSTITNTAIITTGLLAGATQVAHVVIQLRGRQCLRWKLQQANLVRRHIGLPVHRGDTLAGQGRPFQPFYQYIFQQPAVGVTHVGLLGVDEQVDAPRLVHLQDIDVDRDPSVPNLVDMDQSVALKDPESAIHPRHQRTRQGQRPLPGRLLMQL